MAINCQGVRQASRLINVFMYLKIFALGLIIAAGVYVVTTGQYVRFQSIIMVYFIVVFFYKIS